MACQGSIGRPRDSDSDSDRDRAVYNFAITFATDPATPRGASCAWPFIDTLKARAYPSRLFFCRAFARLTKQVQAHETHLPAGQAKAGTHTRLSCAHVDQGGSPRPETAPGQGPRTTDAAIDNVQQSTRCNDRKSSRPTVRRQARLAGKARTRHRADGGHTRTTAFRIRPPTTTFSTGRAEAVTDCSRYCHAGTTWMLRGWGSRSPRSIAGSRRGVTG